MSPPLYLEIVNCMCMQENLRKPDNQEKCHGVS